MVSQSVECEQMIKLYNILTSRLKENLLDAQLILSIIRQPLHVSSVSRPIIRRYNRMYTTIGTYYVFLDDCLLSRLD